MTDERIIAYLLGELPEKEAERFEEECMAGDEWPEEIIVAEEDLIDAFLRDELTAEQRHHFEQNYLNTRERCRRVSMTAGLLRHVDKFGTEEAVEPAPRPRGQSLFDSLVAFWGGRQGVLRVGLALCVVVAVVGAVWVFRSRRAPPRSFATLTLTASVDSDRVAGARAGVVTLSPEADALRIYLELPKPPPAAERFRVELLGEDGEANPLEVAGRDADTVSVEIPATRLSRGRYALRLFAVGPGGAERRVGTYLFNVE